MLKAITRDIYSRALRHFWTWAELAHDLVESYPVDPTLVVEFLCQHLHCHDQHLDQRLVERGAKRDPGPLALGTLQIRLRALDIAHAERGLPAPSRDPLAVLHLERLQHHARQAARPPGGPRQKKPITASVLEQLLAACDDTLSGCQDRALLQLGHAVGGPRVATDLTSLRLEHLEPGPEPGTYSWTTLQTIIRDPAAQALHEWLEHLSQHGVVSGYVFRGIGPHGELSSTAADQQLSTNRLTHMIQHRATAAGLDGRLFGGSSLRRSRPGRVS